MMYLLDSDILSLLHAGHDRVGQRREDVDPADMATTIITKAEILRARCEFLLKAADAEQLVRAQYWLEQSEELLQSIRIVPLDKAAVVRFERLRAQKETENIGNRDLIIAAIALTRGATLVTRNLRHFRPIPSLRLENWADN
jgi:tRNA(fMet)-specific endonuclease VapC